MERCAALQGFHELILGQGVKRCLAGILRAEFEAGGGALHCFAWIPRPVTRAQLPLLPPAFLAHAKLLLYSRHTPTRPCAFPAGSRGILVSDGRQEAADALSSLVATLDKQADSLLEHARQLDALREMLSFKAWSIAR